MNSAQTELVLVALKLWNAMADYAGGIEKRRVFEEFAWGNKVLMPSFHLAILTILTVSISTV
jgi:nucleolar pre-ribosomal-associated protein 1